MEICRTTSIMVVWQMLLVLFILVHDTIIYIFIFKLLFKIIITSNNCTNANAKIFKENKDLLLIKMIKNRAPKNTLVWLRFLLILQKLILLRYKFCDHCLIFWKQLLIKHCSNISSLSFRLFLVIITDTCIFRPSEHL